VDAIERARRRVLSQLPAIDAHQHVVPPEYARWLAAQGWHLPIPDWTADQALAAMDRQQIETALISVTTPGLYLATEPEARRLARQVNEFAAEQGARRPGRFGFFATVTLPDVDGALAEAAYALDELQADGVVLLANVGGRYLGDSLFHPLYAELDRRGAVLFVHPTFPDALGPPLATGNPRSDVDLLAETTRSAVDLVSSGVLARFGRMRVMLAHAGGYLPYMSHRIAPMCSPDGSYQAGLDVLRSFYFDVALSSGGVTLAALMAFARPGHVLFGTDWPYAPPAVIDHFRAELSGYAFAPGQREAVLRTAAEELFPRLGRVRSRG
jgi:predicted TIM-barrel fold metal-dependent hydrolase